jgi:hypothetical protein
MSPMGLGPKKDCSGEAQLLVVNYRPDLSSERAPTSTNPQLFRDRQIRRGSQMGFWPQDRLTDWLWVVLRESPERQLQEQEVGVRGSPDCEDRSHGVKELLPLLEAVTKQPREDPVCSHSMYKYYRTMRRGHLPCTENKHIIWEHKHT